MTGPTGMPNRAEAGVKQGESRESTGVALSGQGPISNAMNEEMGDQDGLEDWEKVSRNRIPLKVSLEDRSGWTEQLVQSSCLPSIANEGLGNSTAS